ncbi:MAG TPA: biotin--[acetyl-CoA-carboxylase] ligase [Streptosporangiaceae bacterium]
MSAEMPGRRSALSFAAVQSALAAAGSGWRDITIVAETGSTNQDLLAAAQRGAAEGTVLVAETQTAGRGRLGRYWQSPPRSALLFSVLLRPAVPPARRGWVPLLAGVAVATALRELTAVDARLKWPNDVQVSGEKLAGLLAEQAGPAIVAGTGLNVHATGDELPPGATSLALHGVGRASRAELLAGLLAEFERRYLRWALVHDGDPAGSGLREDYLQLCATVGRQVRVSLPGGRELAGTASDVDDAGRLVVCAGGQATAVSAGDVVHIR